MKVFVDLDGVLADFDGFYATCFGERPRRDLADPPGFWQNIDGYRDGHFYADLPLMPDAHELLTGVLALHPDAIILTGLPSSLKHAEADKRAWVARHFGAVPVIACASKDKRNHGQPGDVLIDDWDRYRSLWILMGGIFIRHISAKSSLAELAQAHAHG